MLNSKQAQKVCQQYLCPLHLIAPHSEGCSQPQLGSDCCLLVPMLLLKTIRCLEKALTSIVQSASNHTGFCLTFGHVQLPQRQPCCPLAPVAYALGPARNTSTLAHTMPSTATQCLCQLLSAKVSHAGWSVASALGCVSVQSTTRFYSHTVAVIGLLALAHLACFVASVVMLDAQKQYINEVDDAGVACIAMHRMAIDCRCVECVCRQPMQHSSCRRSQSFLRQLTRKRPR